MPFRKKEAETREKVENINKRVFIKTFGCPDFNQNLGQVRATKV